MKGKITGVFANYIVLEVHSIGYSIHSPNPFSFQNDEEVTIYIYPYIREDAFDLYGFKTLEERNLFTKLLSVKGIGPKGALAILAKGEIEELEKAIENSDAKYFQRFPGIGPKASGQIILDLRGKISNTISLNPKVENVKEALRSLGYTSNELKKLDRFLMDHIDLPIEELVKMSLKRMF